MTTRHAHADFIEVWMNLTSDEHRAFCKAAGKQPVTAWLRDLGKLCAAGRVRVEAA